ncbi:hypothetical protein EOA23_00915 [Mesorhizobium sp. M2A.F.Ca.ET.042.01.1.1]|uniref:hypothetical protein n=1 Tax=Mesorhizobium sp. M2A.F.Ca.ET.042.01.1.1 TaxID=2496745 RepID=UPI000FCC1971|nr:hypothetical protein [Mesorhizobium sp. M2A.F.Ca.ET.042.01.1.1]RUX34640.1 hypothetical protein EOA23_00915 [Mesorhizobium sp. M2A.F.Ca.ET.042.01.1.1]
MAKIRHLIGQLAALPRGSKGLFAKSSATVGNRKRSKQALDLKGGLSRAFKALTWSMHPNRGNETGR